MSELDAVRERFTQSLSRIAEFWGYPRAMGALYAALYLAPEPLSLDALVEAVGVTKGAVSTNIRALEQLGMVHKQVRAGDRKDYYEADTDFWKIARTVLERRRQAEFDRALDGVSTALAQVRAARPPKSQADLAGFYEERLAAMESFLHTLDSIVATVLQLDRLRAGGLRALLKPGKRRKP